MTVDKKLVLNQWLPANHVGTFLLLVLVSTFRPEAIWPSFTLSLEPIAIALLFALFIYKVTKSYGIGAFLFKYKYELLGLASYFCICLLSLYLHLDYYSTSGEVIRYGITFIVITSALPIALFTFSLPEQTNKFSLSRFKLACYLPYVLIGLVAILAIWQALAPQNSENVTRFFISGSTANVYRIFNINSIFQTATDTGSILAIMLIFVMYSLCKLQPQGRTVDRDWFIACGMLVTLLVLVSIAGLYNGKRIFILTLLIGVVFTFILTSKKGKIRSILAAVLITTAVHLMIFQMPVHAFENLSKILPYLAMIDNGTIPTLASFVPNLSMETLGPRIHIWSSAVELLQENWLIGISNGAFRMSGSLVEQNTHNVILQILVEAGVVGLAILLCLMVYFGFRHRASKLVRLMPVAICFTLVVDYFPDHSVPWIVIVSYFAIFPSRYERINYEE